MPDPIRVQLPMLAVLTAEQRDAYERANALDGRAADVVRTMRAEAEAVLQKHFTGRAAVEIKR